jgi:hypothetical protein
MLRFHLALSVADIDDSVRDYSARLGCAPTVVVPNEYALWRTETLNFSIRRVASEEAGALRHLGYEDPSAPRFESQCDVNGILWERFTAEQQRDEIQTIWPSARDHSPK